MYGPVWRARWLKPVINLHWHKDSYKTISVIVAELVMKRLKVCVY